MPDDDQRTDPGDRALHKLRTFMLALDRDERVALARLIAPGIERALAADPIQEWSPDAVEQWLKGSR
ncbi:MAG: hypothetical protein R2707_12165 [Acidimicrobiales bacterium]